MTKKSHEPSEFASMFKDVKRVVYDKHVPRKQETTLNIRRNRVLQEQSKKYAGIALSDAFEAHWPEHKAIAYSRSSDFIEKDLLKKLKMGHIPPDLEVDFHGQTAKEAKETLIAAIFEAKKHQLACINIIHGHGNGVLTQKIPNWLVQHPDVVCFIQAPRAFGGKAGLLVFVGSNTYTYKC